MIMFQVVVGSFLSDPFKTQTKAESPLGLSQGTTSGVTTPTPLQRPLKTEAKLSPGMLVQCVSPWKHELKWIP